MGKVKNEMLGHEVVLVDDRHDITTARSRSIFSDSSRRERDPNDELEVGETNLKVTEAPTAVYDGSMTGTHQHSNLVLITPTDHIEEAELIIRYAKHLVQDASQKCTGKETREDLLQVAQNFTKEARTRSLGRDVPSISMLSKSSGKIYVDDKTKLSMVSVNPNNSKTGKENNKNDCCSSKHVLSKDSKDGSERNLVPNEKNGRDSDRNVEISPSKKEYKQNKEGEAVDKYATIAESGNHTGTPYDQEAKIENRDFQLRRSRSSPAKPEQASEQGKSFDQKTSTNEQRVSNKDAGSNQYSSENKRANHMNKRLPRRAAAKHILLANSLDRSSEKDGRQWQTGATNSPLALPPRPHQGSKKYKTLLSKQPALKTRSDLSVSSNSSEQRLAYIWGESNLHDGMLMSSSDEESDSDSDSSDYL